jgi:hypothetical protein
MTTWDLTVREINFTYSPVGLRLLDDLTNQTPLGKVQAILDTKDANGNWQQTNIKASMNSDGVLAYPGLERHAIVTGQPSRQYRVRLVADLYIPYYRINADGIVFTAYPFNDENPPSTVVKVPTDTALVPAKNYPFPPNVPVLRGIVVDATGKQIPDVSVTQGNTERTLTDAKGQFALPLRWVIPKTDTLIDAINQRNGQTRTITIQIPADLGRSQTISIN